MHVANMLSLTGTPWRSTPVLWRTMDVVLLIFNIIVGVGLWTRQPWAVMAFNNLVMSYVTMAPMYRDLLGQDPFSDEALEKQLTLIKTLLRAVFDYRGK